MNAIGKHKGPWTHRLLIYFFSALLTLLLVWLLGFIQKDINKMPGPDYAEIEKKYIDQTILDRMDQIKKEERKLQTQIENQKEVQSILATSTSNSQQTMNQLLEMHKHNLEQGVKPTEAEQNSLAESERIFLENQKKFQDANQVIAQLTDQLRTTQDKIKTLEEENQEKRKPAQEEYSRELKAHGFKVASLKLGILVPLMLIAGWFVILKRSTAYAPILHAGFIATFWRIFLVMHEHFPTDFFKYIAIVAAIVIVLAFLVHLIRMVIAPKTDWLLKQYKEAYTKHLCPVCSYPIERGPLKYVIWSSKGPKIHGPLKSGDAPEEEKPYVCPSCGSSLYENCEKCNAIRPSLLPHCQACGAEKSLT